MAAARPDRSLPQICARACRSPGSRTATWEEVAYRGRVPLSGGACRGRPARKGASMSDSVYSVSEIVGSSTESIDDAIRAAVARASKTLHNLDWFEVSGIRGRIEDDQRCHFQVTLKIGFRLDERPA